MMLDDTRAAFLTVGRFLKDIKLYPWDWKDAEVSRRLKQIVFIIFGLILFVLYARLRILNSYLIRAPRISFGDTADYLLIASQSLLSSKFWLADKPFLVPLFFKLLGGNPEKIFTAQLYFSIICWGVLALVCAYVIRSYVLKYFIFALVLGFSLSQQVILWDSLLLTESLHFSLAALFYAACLLLIKHWNVVNVILVIVFAALLGFTRDANAYLLLMAALVLLFLMAFRQHALRYLLIAGTFIVVFLISLELSAAGGHGYAAQLNLIGLRILPNQEYRAYYQYQGMPVTDHLLEYSGQASHWNGLAMLRDPQLTAFRDWVQKHSKTTLVKFLWHFKADTLQRPLNNPTTVLTPNLYYYSSTGFTPILEKNARLSEILYPMRFGIIAFLLANMLAAFLCAFALTQRKILWLLPLLMILLAYPQLVIVWNADPNDILRHTLHLNVQWRLGIWLLIFFVVDDYWMERLSPMFENLAHRFGLFSSAKTDRG